MKESVVRVRECVRET